MGEERHRAMSTVHPVHLEFHSANSLAVVSTCSTAIPTHRIPSAVLLYHSVAVDLSDGFVAANV